MNAAKLILFNFFCLWLCATVFSSVFSGCSAEKKAQRAAAKQETKRQAHIQLLQETRKKYPCDTSTKVIKTTDVHYLPGTVTYRNDTSFLHDTVVVNNSTHTTNTIIDSAYTEQLINENASLKYGGQMLREQFNETVDKLGREKKAKEEAISDKNGWRKRAIGTWAILGLCTAGLVLMAYLKK